MDDKKLMDENAPENSMDGKWTTKNHCKKTDYVQQPGQHPQFCGIKKQSTKNYFIKNGPSNIFE